MYFSRDCLNYIMMLIIKHSNTYLTSFWHTSDAQSNKLALLTANLKKACRGATNSLTALFRWVIWLYQSTRMRIEINLILYSMYYISMKEIPGSGLGVSMSS